MLRHIRAFPRALQAEVGVGLEGPPDNCSVDCEVSLCHLLLPQRSSPEAMASNKARQHAMITHTQLWPVESRPLWLDLESHDLSSDRGPADLDPSF